MGYQSINVTNARQSGSTVTVAMTARNQNRPWNLTCVYRQSNGSVVMTEQSEAGSGGGGSGNIYADAKNACASQARKLGYQVLDYGSARPQSWGVKQTFVLTKSGLRYSSADCNYIVADRTATVAPGNPDKQAK